MRRRAAGDRPPTRRVAVVGVAIIAVALGVGVRLATLQQRDVEPSAVADSTSTPPRWRSPLTGLGSDTPDQRRAVVVKVDAHPSVSQFPGLERADLVYEVMVEGGIARYLAIFESRDAERVGPVRSLRSSDFDLVANLGDAVVVVSGTNEPTAEAARSEALALFTPQSPGADEAFRRDDRLGAPHNLFVATTAVRSALPQSGVVSAPFEFSQRPERGTPVAGLRVGVGDATDSVVVWNEERREWLRWRDGEPQLDGGDRQLGTDTVLVLTTRYTHPSWDAAVPEAVSVGEGGGVLLAGGRQVEVTWSRAAAGLPFVMTGPAGESVELPPGRTWVAFAPPGSTGPLDSREVSEITDG